METVLTPQEEEHFARLCNQAFEYARTNQANNLATMIQAGLSPHLKTHKGDTLLMLAAYHNALESAQMLLQYGARVDEKNNRGQTPLAGACFKGYLEIVKLLVANGANIDENNGFGMTPLSFAVMFGRKEVAQYLIQQKNIQLKPAKRLWIWVTQWFLKPNIPNTQ